VLEGKLRALVLVSRIGSLLLDEDEMGLIASKEQRANV
jgi:hypothetical protein